MDILRLLYEAHANAPFEDADYIKALDQTCAAEKNLLESYPEISGSLTVYQSAQLELFDHTTHHEYVTGFWTGMKLMLEYMNNMEKYTLFNKELCENKYYILLIINV